MKVEKKQNTKMKEEIQEYIGFQKYKFQFYFNLFLNIVFLIYEKFFSN